MRLLNVRSIVIKKFKNYKTNRKVKQLPNILKQDFKTASINEKWCGDITYIYVSGLGWTYLASVMDMHTNKIIGYSYSKNMDKELVIKAMKNALMNTRVKVKENTKEKENKENTNIKETNIKKPRLIFHSDLGSQYTSKEFNEFLKQKGIRHSYSNKGTPYDNAKIESFHSLIKKEEIYVNRYKTFEQAKTRIFEYIESFYNRKRIHSSIGYLTPQEKEDEAIEIMKKQ